jgi:hypothetical protein
LDTYRLRVRPKGAWTSKEKEVALHDADSVDSILAAVPAVLGRAAKQGDQVEVFAGHKRIKKFTV